MASQIVTGVLHCRLSRFAYLASHEMVHSIVQNLHAAAGARESAAWAEAASGSERVYTSYKSRTTITKLKAITRHRRFSSSSSVEPAMYLYVRRDTVTERVYIPWPVRVRLG